MRRLLIRLYPAAWRTRYGDGFEALLAEVSHSPVLLDRVVPMSTSSSQIERGCVRVSSVARRR